MGVDLTSYRARIGTFAGGRLNHARQSKSPCLEIGSTKSRLVVYLVFLVAISLLVIAGDIEQNPGPGPDIEQQQRQTRQTTLRLSTSQNPDDPIMTVLKQVQTQLSNGEEVIKQKFDELNRKLDGHILKIEEENKQLKGKITKLEEKVDRLETNERKQNLILHGLVGDKGEKRAVTEKKALDFIKGSFGVELSGDVNVTRLTKGKENGPIKLSFLLLKDRENVLFAGKEFKRANPDDDGPYITEDFSIKIRETRKKLGPFLGKAREDGHKVKMVTDKLLIDGKLYVYDTVKNDITPMAKNGAAK